MRAAILEYSESGRKAVSIATLQVEELQTNLADLLSLVTSGQEVVLTKGSMPIARVVPVAPPRAPRVPGLHAGAAWTSDDFDGPLPDDFWSGGGQ
jgi:prevent-host-death family protein